MTQFYAILVKNVAIWRIFQVELQFENKSSNWLHFTQYCLWTLQFYDFFKSNQNAKLTRQIDFFSYYFAYEDMKISSNCNAKINRQIDTILLMNVAIWRIFSRKIAIQKKTSSNWLGFVRFWIMNFAIWRVFQVNLQCTK